MAVVNGIENIQRVSTVYVVHPRVVETYVHRPVATFGPKWLDTTNIPLSQTL